MMRLKAFLIVFLLGGTVYALVEVLFRGFTHWSMFLAGGLIFYVLFRLFAALGQGRLLRKCVLGCAVITTAEFLVGAVVNLLLQMRIWDYSGFPMNLFGQICPSFSAGWFFLSLPVAGLAYGLQKRLQ